MVTTTATTTMSASKKGKATQLPATPTGKVTPKVLTLTQSFRNIREAGLDNQVSQPDSEDNGNNGDNNDNLVDFTGDDDDSDEDEDDDNVEDANNNADEGDDDDTDEVVEVAPPPPKVQPRYSSHEDLCIAKGYNVASVDSIVGANQKSQRFKDKMHKYYIKFVKSCSSMSHAQKEVAKQRQCRPIYTRFKSALAPAAYTLMIEVHRHKPASGESPLDLQKRIEDGYKMVMQDKLKTKSYPSMSHIFPTYELLKGNPRFSAFNTVILRDKAIGKPAKAPNNGNSNGNGDGSKDKDEDEDEDKKVTAIERPVGQKAAIKNKMVEKVVETVTKKVKVDTEDGFGDRFFKQQEKLQDCIVKLTDSSIQANKSMSTLLQHIHGSTVAEMLTREEQVEYARRQMQVIYHAQDVVLNTPIASTTVVTPAAKKRQVDYDALDTGIDYHYSDEDE